MEGEVVAPGDAAYDEARKIWNGMLDRYPNLRIITHHMGGMIPYFEGRVGYGWDQLGTRSSDDVCTYSDIDMRIDSRAGRYTHKDGTPYPERERS